MQNSNYKAGRTFLCRLKHNSELVRSILEFAKEKKLKMAVFTAVGSVKKASLAYYDQEKREYQKIKFEKPLEIAGVFGNISLKDGEPFVHAHAVLADANGKTYAGHLLKATIFAGEVYFKELLGKELEREYDHTTGLALWSFEG